MMVMDDSEETQERWLRTLSSICGADLNISSALSEEEAESVEYEGDSDLSWASRASAPNVWLSESDSEEEEEEVDLGHDEDFDVELLVEDINKKDEVVEEEVEEEISSVECENFV